MTELSQVEPATLTPPQVAKKIGVTDERVREWMRRADDPLPSIQVGASGRYRRVLADEVQPWLAREAERTRPHR